MITTPQRLNSFILVEPNLSDVRVAIESPLSGLYPAVPDRIVHAVEMALAREPERRPTAEEFGRAFAHV